MTPPKQHTYIARFHIANQDFYRPVKAVNKYQARKKAILSAADAFPNVLFILESLATVHSQALIKALTKTEVPN